ncbi:MAG: cadherin-like beta sandwich domain-containing protein [Clostridia bacterium]|nr:cadherin-like beta sandwich domain-containing protein [Clostridia bacterium]
MKKLIGLVISLVLLVAVSLIPASANSGSLSASGDARPGETFNVTFTASGAVGSYSGSFSYDTGLVTLVSVSNGGGSHWSSFSHSGNNVFAQRDSGTTDSVSFTATFKVNNGVTPGTSINIGFSGSIATNVNAEDSFSVSTSRTVAAPLSDDCDLSGLTVGNATLSPAFSPSTTSYSCGKVKFDVAKLNISATAHDNSASVAVNGANLAVGKNNVRIVVTAPSGKTKTYTIAIEREQDPNYVPNSETELSSLTVSEGKLSPEFAIKTREYVVYLPYEVETISIKGETANDLIKEIKNIEDYKLKVGTNELKIEITAEDDSVGTYTVYVVRMDKFGGKDTVGVPASLLNKTAEPEVKDTEPVATTQGVSPIILGVAALACLLLGFAIGAIVFKKKNKGGELELEDDFKVEPVETGEEAEIFKPDDDNYLKYFEDEDK